MGQTPPPEESRRQEKPESTSGFLGPRPHRNSGHLTLPRKLIKEENRLTFSGLFGSTVEPPPRGFQSKAIRPVEVGCVDTFGDYKRYLFSFKTP